MMQIKTIWNRGEKFQNYIRQKIGKEANIKDVEKIDLFFGYCFPGDKIAEVRYNGNLIGIVYCQINERFELDVSYNEIKFP